MTGTSNNSTGFFRSAHSGHKCINVKESRANIYARLFGRILKLQDLRLMPWRYARVNARRKRALSLLFAKGVQKRFSFLFRTCLCLPRKADTENPRVSDPILYRELSRLRDSRLFIVHESANCANVFHVILLFSIFYRLIRCFLFQQTRDQGGDLAEIVVIGVP